MMNTEKLDHSELIPQPSLRSQSGSLLPKKALVPDIKMHLLETTAPAILSPQCWVHEKLDRDADGVL